MPIKSDRCITCHRRHKRSNPQNALYWVLLHKAAEQLRPNGQAFSPESYHTLFKSKHLGCDDIALPTGKTMTLPRSTANLDVHEFSEFFTKVEAELAEHGIYLDSLEAA